jgi:outer membrane immunogenic protein
MPRSVVLSVTGAMVTLVSLVFTQAASAADMPVKAPPPPTVAKLPYDWSGLYIGGHLGYLWGRTRVEEDGVVTDPNASTNGTIGGVMVGYNWQRGPIVFGLEGDFGWTNAHGTGNVIPPPPPPPTVVTTEQPNTYDVKWTTHVRGRAGYAIDNWLFYVAGGLAVADFNFREGGTSTTTAVIVGAKYTGWSIGGGIAVAVTRNIIASIEYLYDDFGHKDYIGVTGDPYRVDFRGQTLRGAVAWKFDGLRP